MFREAYKAGADSIEYRGPDTSAAVWDGLMLRYMNADDPADTLRMVWAAILLGASGGRSALAVPESEVQAESMLPEASQAGWATGTVYGVPLEGPAPADSAWAVEYLKPILEAPPESGFGAGGIILLVALLFLAGGIR